MSRTFGEIARDLEEVFHAGLASRDENTSYAVAKAIRKVFCRDIINKKEFREKRADILTTFLLNLARSAYKQQMETIAENILNDIGSSILELMLMENPEVRECGKKITLRLLERSTFFSYQNDLYEQFETERSVTYIFPKLVQDLYENEKADHFIEFAALYETALDHVFQNNNLNINLKAAAQFSNIGYKVAKKDGKKKPSDEFIKKLLATTYGYVHVFNHRRKSGIEPQRCMEVISRLLFGVFELAPLIVVPSFIKITKELAYLLDELELNVWSTGIGRLRNSLPDMLDALSQQSKEDVMGQQAYWYVQTWSVLPRVTCQAIFGDKKSYLSRQEMGSYSAALVKTFRAILNIQDEQCRAGAIDSYLIGLDEFFPVTTVANEYIQKNVFGILLAAGCVAYQQSRRDVAKAILTHFKKAGKQADQYWNEAHNAFWAGFNLQITVKDFAKLFDECLKLQEKDRSNDA
ncbi:MAG: hypothetical protein A3G41_05025 [Elusimicrobia bacterium RIFCSPLOWO2_12_FULL_59_9]|nr:MAG: hypothetical protein A3G41_05025 [Elusimicrobia bacterium RIFCSPLOWO2_12_FULL_59_9]